MNIFSFTGNSYQSSEISDIVRINEASTETKDIIRIMELGSLDGVMPLSAAESIRRRLLEKKVRVQQLTNHRSFGPWTEVDGFTDECMRIRFTPKESLTINTEILILDDIVALYRVEPAVMVMIIRDVDLARMQKQLFDAVWQTAESLKVRTDGSTE